MITAALALLGFGTAHQDLPSYPLRVSSENHGPPVDLLDARGLRCPLPVVRTRERFKTLPPGGRLDVLADDPLARLDMQAFCAREGHPYLGEFQEPGGGWRMALRRSEAVSRP